MEESMDTKYIHTEQLLNSKKAIENNLYPLKTFIGWALFGKKDRISPGLAVIETKGRLLRAHYELSSEEIVEKVSKFLITSLVQFVEGHKNIKSFLLTNINYALDRMMSDTRKIEAVRVPKAMRSYRERELDSQAMRSEHRLESDDNEIEIFERIEAKKPSDSPAKNFDVVVRRKRLEPDVRTFLDLYDKDF
jgi:hypothetical protein